MLHALSSAQPIAAILAGLCVTLVVACLWLYALRSSDRGNVWRARYYDVIVELDDAKRDRDDAIARAVSAESVVCTQQQKIFRLQERVRKWERHCGELIDGDRIDMTRLVKPLAESPEPPPEPPPISDAGKTRSLRPPPFPWQPMPYPLEESDT